MAALERLRTDYGLDDKTLARCFGVAQPTMLGWAKGKTTPASADRQRIQRLTGILKGLARVMKRDFIGVWLTRPNDALEGQAPVDHLAQGGYEAVEDLVYFLEAGEPV